MPDSAPQQQLLHLVIGGELIDFEHNIFKDLDRVDIVGVFPNYATAYAAWKAKHFPGRPLLVQTGAMRAALTSAGAPPRARATQRTRARSR